MVEERTKARQMKPAGADERQSFRRRPLRHAPFGGFGALNLLLHTIVFAVGWQAMQREYIPLEATSLMLVAFFFLLFHGVCKMHGAFRIGLVKPLDIATAQIVSLLIVHVLCLFVERMPLRRLADARVPVLCLTGSAAMAVAWSFAARRVYYPICAALKTAVLYGIPEAKYSAEGLYRQIGRFNVTSTIDVRHTTIAWTNCTNGLQARRPYFCAASLPARAMIF